MRGILYHEDTADFPEGITPAHAGNTVDFHEMLDKAGDHPRACGEYDVFGRFAIKVQGSPPRMRGIL